MPIHYQPIAPLVGGYFVSMHPWLRVLLDGVFDYAGLFPPAKLGMAEAIEKYDGHRKGPEGWMVSRFVCSSARVPEFVEILAALPGMEEIPLSIVGRPSTTYDEWQDALEKDARGMTDLIGALGSNVSIEAYEVRVPSHGDIAACLQDLRAFSQVDVFAELPWGDGMDESLAQIAMTETIFAKARTGGMEASAVPSADELAGFIHQCVSLELPFKLTAGLHHAHPVLDPATGGRMHGFLNVLGATAWAIYDQMSREQVAQVLEKSDLNILAVLEDFFVPEDARELFVGIGSCSIDEPVADLTALGLYP